jgi:REP element-mobilizing transposase RayT
MSESDRGSEGHASACPKFEARDAMKQDVQKHVPPQPERRHPVHLAPLEAHNRSIIVFVTACTAKRRQVLASASAHDAIVRAWFSASAWLVGRYVIMPDHIHLFCAPNSMEAPSLERWMRFWKSLATRSLGERSGAIWQRHHWDRQLRSGEAYDDKWEYVRSNPVRHGLVADPDDWPYQGELNILQW